MVGIVVISFFGVVIKLSTSGEADWNKIISGFIPDFLFLIIRQIFIYLFSKKQVNSEAFGK